MSTMKSSFSRDEHPVRSSPLSSLDTKSAGAQTSAKKAQPAKEIPVKKERVSIYAAKAEINRLRETFARNMVDEGFESLSDFIMKAALKEAVRLEKKYNDGKPYEGIAKVSAGRPAKRA